MALNLQDYPEDTDRRDGSDRRFLHVASNEKSGWDRDGIAKFLIPIILAAIVSYFTAQKSTAEQLATVKTLEQVHFEEVIRRLDRIERWQDGKKQP